MGSLIALKFLDKHHDRPVCCGHTIVQYARKLTCWEKWHYDIDVNIETYLFRGKINKWQVSMGKYIFFYNINWRRRKNIHKVEPNLRAGLCKPTTLLCLRCFIFVVLASLFVNSVKKFRTNSFNIFTVYLTTLFDITTERLFVWNLLPFAIITLSNYVFPSSRGSSPEFSVSVCRGRYLFHLSWLSYNLGTPLSLCIN